MLLKIFSNQSGIPENQAVVAVNRPEIEIPQIQSMRHANIAIQHNETAMQPHGDDEAATETRKPRTSFDYPLTRMH
jgi:hypothetical protein